MAFWTRKAQTSSLFAKGDNGYIANYSDKKTLPWEKKFTAKVGRDEKLTPAAKGNPGTNEKALTAWGCWPGSKRFTRLTSGRASSPLKPCQLILKDTLQPAHCENYGYEPSKLTLTSW